MTKTASIAGLPLVEPSQLTPDGIAGLHFTHRRFTQGGGYDEDEVDAALDMLEEVVADLMRSRDAAVHEVEEWRRTQPEGAVIPPALPHRSPSLPDRETLEGIVAEALLEANRASRDRGTRAVVSPPALPGVAEHVVAGLLRHHEAVMQDEAPAAGTDTGALTAAEHAVVESLGRAWNLLMEQVIEPGSAHADDMREIVAPLHAVQNAVLAQAASRAYPDRYRPLGLSHAEWMEAQP